METFNWAEDIEGAVTVCDTEGEAFSVLPRPADPGRPIAKTAFLHYRQMRHYDAEVKRICRF